MNIYDVGLTFNNLSDGNNNPKSLVVHHIEADNASVNDIHSWHKSNDWAGIGYHYYIRKDGSIYKGRPDSAMGSHCKGFNKNSLGISFEGNYDNNISMPVEQLNAWFELRDYLFNCYGSMPVYGHKEVGDSACPGAYFPLDTIKGSKSQPKATGYVVTNYLPNAYEGYDGVNLEYVLKYFNGHTCYMRHDSKGMWIETQVLSMEQCENLRQALGSWFYKIV